MLKSGLIVGGIAFVLAIAGSFVSSVVCAPCWGLFSGLGAGFLGGAFEKPGDTRRAARVGAGAGAIGGVGGLIGQVAGGLLNAVIVGPEATAELMRQLFGLPTAQASPGAFYAGAFGISCCLGLLVVALMAGMGALGGLLWHQTQGKSSAPGMPA